MDQGRLRQFQNFFGRTAFSQNQGRGETAKEYEAIIKKLGAETTQRGNQLRQSSARSWPKARRFRSRNWS